MNTKFKNSSTGDKVFVILVYVLLSAVMLIVLYPLIYIISASFSDPQAVVSGKVVLWPVDVTLRGYKAVFKNPKIITGFINSFIYMGVGTVVNLIMTMLCAYPLSRKEFTARNKIAALFVFTMYFSGGLMPTYMVVNKLGLINTRWAMIIPSAMSTYNMIIARTYMVNSIPDELYEAAQIDGCSPFKYLLKVVVPLCKPILAVLTLYYGIAKWNNYFDAMLYLNDASLQPSPFKYLLKVVVPLCKPILAVLTLYYGIAKWNNYFDAMLYLNDASLQPLTIVLREILIQNQIDPTMLTDASALSKLQGMTELLKYAVIVVASVPVLAIYPFVQKYFVKGVTIGAVKG